MKTKRKRFLRLKFNIFVLLLCFGTVGLGYGFHQNHLADIVMPQAEAAKEEKVEPVKETMQMVQIKKVAAETSTSTSEDDGADTNGDVLNNIPVYESPDTTSVVLEEVFTGEWAQLISEEEGFVEVKTNAGNQGFVAEEQAQISTVDKKTTKSSLENSVILLDPGHGGNDPGAESSNKYYLEKNLTLATAEAVRDALEEAGATVYLTREDDSYVSLDDRTKMAIEESADIFISLHYDSYATSDTLSGYTTYYYYEASEALADNINRGLLDNVTSLNNLGLRTDNFEVTRETPYPSVLLELGYINNYADLIVITEESYYNQVAKGIVEGIESYFNQ